MMRWYRRLFRRARTERQLDAELRFHLEQQIADYVAAGMTPEEARRRARLEFGGIDQVKEECRDVGAVRFVETLIQDLRYGLRQLRRNPGFTAVAVITLALGIGANTAIFSVVNAVVLQPLPYRHPSRLVMVYHVPPAKSFPGMTKFAVSPANYLDWRRQNHAFDPIAIYGGRGMNLTGRVQPEAVTAAKVSAGFFATLGVPPRIGRAFTPDEERPGHANEVILGNAFWHA